MIAEPDTPKASEWISIRASELGRKWINENVTLDKGWPGPFPREQLAIQALTEYLDQFPPKP